MVLSVVMRSTWPFWLLRCLVENISFLAATAIYTCSGPITLGKIDYLTGEPLSEQLAASYRQVLLATFSSCVQLDSSVHNNSSGERGKRMSFEMSLPDMMSPGSRFDLLSIFAFPSPQHLRIRGRYVLCSKGTCMTVASDTARGTFQRKMRTSRRTPRFSRKTTLQDIDKAFDHI